MKKFSLTLTSFFILSSAFSQSKFETEEWIKGKFNKWKITDVRSQKNSMSGYSEKPISLTFNNCQLTFKTILTNFLSPSSPDYNTYNLNIGDIEEFKWINFNNTNYFVIITNKSRVKRTTGSESSYLDRCVLAFNIDGEEDFEQRMLKAFNHLKSFCPAPKKPKEVF